MIIVSSGPTIYNKICCIINDQATRLKLVCQVHIEHSPETKMKLN